MWEKKYPRLRSSQVQDLNMKKQLLCWKNQKKAGKSFNLFAKIWWGPWVQVLRSVYTVFPLAATANLGK